MNNNNTFLPPKKINALKLGFTLAEVLITLVIIGVLAAITVPFLLQSTEKQEFVSALIKADSVLRNSLYKISINTGFPMGDYTYLNESNFIKEMAKVTNTIKICNSTDECFQGGRTKYKYLNGINCTDNFTNGKALITADGQLYTFAVPSAQVGISEEDKQNTIGRIIVDINGSRKPNKYGRDVFFFYIVNGKGIVPAGSFEHNNCKKTREGNTCAARVLKEKAMNY